MRFNLRAGWAEVVDLLLLVLKSRPILTRASRLSVFVRGRAVYNLRVSRTSGCERGREKSGWGGSGAYIKYKFNGAWSACARVLAARGVPDRYGGGLCGCAWTKLALKHILATHNLHWRGNFGQRCGGVVLHARARRDHARFRACARVWFVLPHSLVWKSRRQGALTTGRARLSWGCMSPKFITTAMTPQSGRGDNP